MRNFNDLNNTEKLKAIFAGAISPMPLSYAIEFVEGITGEETEIVISDPRLVRGEKPGYAWFGENADAVVKELDIDREEVLDIITKDMMKLAREMFPSLGEDFK